MAQGGVGKTALVSHWLQHLAEWKWRDFKRVYAWSFYSQGSERQSSSDAFIRAALAFFGHQGEAPREEHEQGSLLARLVRQHKTLLVLDGMEPLQAVDGRVNDRALRALLRDLSRDNPGLCVITTRVAAAELNGKPRIDLVHLSEEAGAHLLESLGVDGPEAQRREASREFAGHALALTLLGTLLTRFCGGDLRRRSEIPLLADDIHQGRHARRVMLSYEAWLGPDHLAILRLVGLFDRPAEAALVTVLRGDGALPGLAAMDERRWQGALADLRGLRLLSPADSSGELDAHPLVREYFGGRLRDSAPEAWAAAHTRLYRHLRDTTGELPDTAAGLTPQALEEVFQRRIRRGAEHFSIHHLGAFGADLTCLWSFFVESWSRVAAGVGDHDKAYLLGSAGFGLRAVGRLEEAAAAMAAALAEEERNEDWRNAAIVAGNLSETELLRGGIERASEAARRAMDLAVSAGDEFREIVALTTLADTRAQAGDTAAAQLFAEAERKQQEMAADYPWLYSLRGYQYCDLLLTMGQAAAVRDRAQTAIGWEKRPLGIALDTLTLGRAAAQLGQRAEAKGLLDSAVARLREAGTEDLLPRGLLARAAFRRQEGDLRGAADDLAEVRDIAEGGGMRLFLADLELEETRLALARHDRPAARSHLAIARALVERCGYGRRRPEVAELEAALA